MSQIPFSPTMTSLNEPLPERITNAVDDLNAQLEAVRTSIGNVIFGQEHVVEESLITILSGGHVLLVGVPGLAKTRLVQTLGTVLGMNDNRIQFTPDLMPSDILGAEVLEEKPDGSRGFRFIQGPIFCRLLMADEINRASPRTQSALLQAMQEHKVSIAGQHYPLPEPFHVLATQNPLEQEGTYPLPEAQLDRFLMQINVDYPDREAERRMLLATTGGDTPKCERVMNAEALLAAQGLIRRLPVGESVVNAILDLVRAARPETSDLEAVRKNVAWGPGPRASQALMLAVRARALIQGRFAPSIDDVAALMAPILVHRMALNFAARAEGADLASIIDALRSRLN